MNVFVSHVYCLIESLVSILRYKDITIIKSQYRIIIKNLLFFCANVYTKQRLTFCCTRYFLLLKGQLMKDKMASDHLKSIKIDPGNLWNRFLFCNTFLLHIRYLHHTACSILMRKDNTAKTVICSIHHTQPILSQSEDTSDEGGEGKRDISLLRIRH